MLRLLGTLDFSFILEATWNEPMTHWVILIECFSRNSASFCPTLALYMEVVDLEAKEDKCEPTLPTEWRVTFLPVPLASQLCPSLPVSQNLQGSFYWSSLGSRALQMMSRGVRKRHSGTVGRTSPGVCISPQVSVDYSKQSSSVSLWGTSF